MGSDGRHTARLWLLAGVALCAACVRDVYVGSVQRPSPPAAADVVARLDDAPGGDGGPADAPAPADGLAPDGGLDPDLPVAGPCAVAVMKITPGEVVVPSTTVQLCGDHSLPSVLGEVVGWQWTVQQPEGSKQIFLPGPLHPCPTFRPDMAGKYTFCLQVVDASGKKGCEAVCRSVLVYPDQQIHVELYWDTPGDPDETPASPPGADLDLHFAHDKAKGLGIQADCAGAPHPWFDPTFDAYWNNPNPNWGLANPDARDDPSLDLDDTDGAGPENLSLEDPEGTLQQPVHYKVGVHYLNDHGFGVSKAHVRVYRENFVIFESGPVWLEPLDMWTVGRIAWPNAGNGGLEKFFTPCRMQGLACEGGKAWVPNGQPCVNPCFKPPAVIGEAAGKLSCK